METGGLGSGMHSAMDPTLGLEMPGIRQNPPNVHNATFSLQHRTVVGYDSHHPHAQQIKPSGYAYSSYKPKHQLTLSDDDEPGFNLDESSGGDPKRNAAGGAGSGSCNISSPWQRMKWTDTMVRLLIAAVFYIGDEGGPETTSDPKKKSGGGLLQKKGKWKSVSKAMMVKGFYVSPQQCEDKFNDLNKRYKRVNDILGRGTACGVVENQSLVETMDLSPKMKEEVKKLLNSKHLFFREMCAYHTSCGHGVSACGGGSGGAQNSAEPPNPQTHQRCLQGAASAESHPHLGEKVINKAEADSSKEVRRGGSGKEYDEDDDDDDEDNYYYYDDDDDDEHEDDEHENRSSRKRSRGVSYSPSPAMMQQLNGEVTGIVTDAGKSPWEKKQWVKGRMLLLEDQQLRYRGEAYELERQRLKWVKFSRKKERDMEMAKLENERRLLEKERMLLLLRQKEIELLVD